MKIVIDDFGIDDRNDEAILTLLKRKHSIFGISCITVGSKDSPELDSLHSLKKVPDVKVGLHVTLTNFYSAANEDKRLPTFPMLVYLSLFSPGSLSWIRNEVREQVDQFIKVMGRFPDFIDGHQHVHQLPYVRKAVLDVVKDYKWPSDFFIRNSYVSFKTLLATYSIGLNSFFKNFFLGMLGRNYKKLLTEKGIQTNDQLLGTYSQRDDVDYAKTFSLFRFQATTGQDVFYTHAGKNSPDLLRLEKSQPLRTEELLFFETLFLSKHQ